MSRPLISTPGIVPPQKIAPSSPDSTSSYHSPPSSRERSPFLFVPVSGQEPPPVRVRFHHNRHETPRPPSPGLSGPFLSPIPAKSGAEFDECIKALLAVKQTRAQWSRTPSPAQADKTKVDLDLPAKIPELIKTPKSNVSADTSPDFQWPPLPKAVPESNMVYCCIVS
ncbi:MAG: hypothetical protein ACI9BD_000184 [Candidatus Marinamargulisbacteria bacterium]|jgi:hypothetical protein